MDSARRVRLASLLVLLAILRPLGAQTVRPAVVEYPNQARGKFELVNESLFPLTVVLEPRGFHVEPTGELIEEPLDTARVQVKISAMSFRIPPRETYTGGRLSPFSSQPPHARDPVERRRNAGKARAAIRELHS